MEVFDQWEWYHDYLLRCACVTRLCMREVIGRRVFWRDRYLLCFGSGRNIRLDGGLEIDNSDMIVGGEVDAVVGDAGLFFLLHCLALYDRPIVLHFPFLAL